MAENVYKMGSIFNVIYKKLNTNETINRSLLLVQSKFNKFLLIDLDSGNRWTDKLIDGNDNIVKEKNIIKSLYINDSVLLDKVDFIRNISEIDIYR